MNPASSLVTRLSLCLRTWAFKTVSSTLFTIVGISSLSAFTKFSPTYTKKYPARPTLECRIFVPNTHKPGLSHPLYIDVHGGGFFAGDARLDDKFCHYFSNTFGYVVVSLQYRLAPSYPFPIPVDDCVELAIALLADTDLPIDHDKVVMGGMSAGATLTLAAAQDPRLKSKIKALVAFYPATDFSHKFTGDYRDKPAGPNGKGATSDGLRPVVPLAEWAYVPYGQDLTNQRLSPVYADSADLPAHIYFITAQYDKLTTETFHMAQRLAKNQTAREEEDWTMNGIRWEMLPNEVHGFIEEAWGQELWGGQDAPWKPEVGALLSRVDKWLYEIFNGTKKDASVGSQH